MVHDKIKDYVVTNGIKQTWLAEKINFPKSKLSEILSGRRPLYADVLATICDALDVSSETFTKK